MLDPVVVRNLAGCVDGDIKDTASQVSLTRTLLERGTLGILPLAETRSRAFVKTLTISLPLRPTPKAAGDQR